MQDSQHKIESNSKLHPKVLDLGHQSDDRNLSNFKSESVNNNDRRRQVSEDVHFMNHLKRRRQSQGLSENKSVGKTMNAFYSKIGTVGKIVADYVPSEENSSNRNNELNLQAVLPKCMTNSNASVSRASESVSSEQRSFGGVNFHRPISKKASQNSTSIVDQMLEKQSNGSAASRAIVIGSNFKKDRVVGSITVKNTAPLQQNYDSLIQTPKKKKQEEAAEEEEDQELLVDSEEDKSEKDSEEEDDDSENEAEKELVNEEKLRIQKEKEQEEMKKFARANGFKLSYETDEKEQKSKFIGPDGKLTKEFFDIQQQKDMRTLFLQSLDEAVTPAADILKRKVYDVEPVRTGFNMGMLSFSIKNNFENARAPQGPNIVITTAAKRSESSVERRASRNGTRMSSSASKRLRSASKESKLNSIPQKSEASAKEENGTNQADPNDEQVQIVQQNLPNTETSLRHLFYLEYKKNFPEGESNPIVYSRFGKLAYDSDCRFDPNNFNQLIRTCNLKKIIRYQENMDKGITRKNESKYYDPISVPHGDYYKPKDASDKTLVFESRFESGNLQLVHKQNDNEYDLVLQNDINSKGHTQWFFYRVKNVKKGLKVKFNMLNMIKSKSLFNEGMKVLCYSERKQEIAEEQNLEDLKGWSRTGEDMSYSQNNYKKDQQTNNSRCFYTFTFTHTFEHDDDTVYFAYSLPYTYSDLTKYLNEIQKKKLNYVSRNLLCRTIAGNKCEYLTITNRVSYEEDKKKEGVIISARIHPGESNASYMIKGVIDYLISDDPKANELRNQFVFKIIPMLNPDGVINGNYRCSLAGCDLNRRWKYPSQMLHPTVYHTKRLITKMASERHLALYCDLHGHSRRKNAFFYGNSQIDNPEAARVFPFLMSKIAHPHYSYDYSRFNIARSKEQTARIAMWRDLGAKHSNIFTLEASFCGPKPVKYEPHRGYKKAPSAQELNYHFNTADFEKIGRNLCQTLILYKEEKANPCGLQNVELLVQKYQIEKENKIEQENLIRQQQLITEQRKAQQNQIKNRVSNWAEDKSLTRGINNKESSGVKEREGSTAKKMLTGKSRTMQVAGNEDLNGQKKKKVNYNVNHNSDGESDMESDSGPSEDNLDSDQIMKLIPKKFGKHKYLKGVEETKKKRKKKVDDSEQKSKKKPQPSAALMPCMSQKKDREKKMEEINASHKKNERETSTAKKMVREGQKLVCTFMRNNGKQRDVGTQIVYKNKDGQNLSLMELDILRHTGCKWSKIIFPGYKGYIKPSERGSASKDYGFLSAEKFKLDSAQRKLNQSPSQEKSLISNFNSDLSEVEGGLRKKSNPFSNELIQQMANASIEKKDSQMNSLQKKIMDVNFQNETRSLFANKNGGQRESSKKRRIMGLEMSNEKQKTYEKGKYDFGDLETVHENEKQNSGNKGATIDYPSAPVKIANSEVKIKKNFSINQQSSVTKKIMNGGIVLQGNLSGQKQLKLDSGVLKSNSGHKTQSQMSAYKHKQRNSSTKNALENKSSFTSVGHQILNNSIVVDRTTLNAVDTKIRAFDLDGVLNNNPVDFTQVANVAPSQMASRLKKIQNSHDKRDSIMRRSFVE